MQQQVASGTVVGTGAAINVQLGWIPDYVVVWNYTDTAAAGVRMDWQRGMADASAFKTLKTIDSGVTGKASHAKITTLGISKYTGVAGSASKGFTIGADTDLNVVGDTMVWRAERNGPGAAD